MVSVMPARDAQGKPRLFQLAAVASLHDDGFAPCVTVAPNGEVLQITPMAAEEVRAFAAGKGFCRLGGSSYNPEMIAWMERRRGHGLLIGFDGWTNQPKGNLSHDQMLHLWRTAALEDFNCQGHASPARATAWTGKILRTTNNFFKVSRRHREPFDEFAVANYWLRTQDGGWINPLQLRVFSERYYLRLDLGDEFKTSDLDDGGRDWVYSQDWFEADATNLINLALVREVVTDYITGTATADLGSGVLFPLKPEKAEELNAALLGRSHLPVAA